MSMKKNDLSFFYHSVSEKAIYWYTKIVREFYPDPTDKLENSLLSMLKHLRKIKNKVTLQKIKSNKKLKNIIVKQSRLSVMPIE